MAAFIAGDQPVANFDYEKPEDFPQGGSQALEVAGQTLPVAQTVDAFVGSWSDLTLPEAGAYPVYGVVTVEGRRQRSLVDTLIVVDPDDPWFNVVTARSDWDGAPESDGLLHRLLNISREQVEAQAFPEDLRAEVLPERLRMGQIWQARNIASASITDDNGSINVGDGVVLTPRPLDPSVKQMIRPRRALKAVG